MLDLIINGLETAPARHCFTYAIFWQGVGKIKGSHIFLSMRCKTILYHNWSILSTTWLERGLRFFSSEASKAWGVWSGLKSACSEHLARKIVEQKFAIVYDALYNDYFLDIYAQYQHFLAQTLPESVTDQGKSLIDLSDLCFWKEHLPTIQSDVTKA